MKPIPSKIEHCPIAEAVFELRFVPAFPAEAVFGVFYQIISEEFPKAELVNLPILQIPEAIRQSDPNFIYQSHHKMLRENHSISIGPRVLLFSNKVPYAGWNEWFGFIQLIVAKLLQAKVFSRVERTGLRYINIFRQEVFSIADITIGIGSQFLGSQSTSVRTELVEDQITKVLQISNNVHISHEGHSFNGSLIDIDIITQLDVDNSGFEKEFKEILETSHGKEKELFFDLLRADFVQTLNPSYEEG